MNVFDHSSKNNIDKSYFNRNNGCIFIKLDKLHILEIVDQSCSSIAKYSMFLFLEEFSSQVDGFDLCSIILYDCNNYISYCKD
jgi:hypothetical protein